jgi:hypothetical protein
MGFKGDMPTEATFLETELRLRVRRRINGGRLPVALVSRIDSSYWTGRVCCVCDQPITHEIVDYDVVDLRRKTARLSLSFHFPCYVIWQQECANRLANAKRTKLRDDRPVSQLIH